MKIPQEKIDEIIQASDIVDVISGYTQVKVRGKTHLALCPFHPDKNPSLHISRAKQVYHCFSCKASGNVITFIKEYDKITFVDAMLKLAERAGIAVNMNDTSPDLSNEISKLFEINKAAGIYYHNKLMKVKGYEKDFVWEYLKGRELSRDTIKKFGIGYAEKDWNSLFNYFLEDAIFTQEEIEKAGLIKQSDSDNSKYYDRFRGRLMFPIFSESDKLIAFGGRKLYDDDPGGKYINSPETKIYSKSKVLYGLNFSRENIRQSDFVILVEGYLDLISMYQAGIKNVVASSGTALTVEQVQLIKRYTNNVVMIYDADLAGIKATKRGIELILEAGLDLSVVSLPEGEDPDSVVRKKGKEEFEKFINNKLSIIEFISNLYEKENKLSTVNEKTEFVKEIISYVSKIPEKIKRAFYVKELTAKYNLYESDLRDEMVKLMKQNFKDKLPQSSIVLPKSKTTHIKKETKKILQEELDLIDIFINADGRALDYIFDKIETNFIQNKSVLEIVILFMDEYSNEGKVDVARIINEIETPEANEIIGMISSQRYEASKSDSFALRHSILTKTERKNTDYLKVAKDVLKKFKISSKQREIKELKKEGTDYNKILKLQREIDYITKNGIGEVQ